MACLTCKQMVAQHKHISSRPNARRATSSSKHSLQLTLSSHHHKHQDQPKRTHPLSFSTIQSRVSYRSRYTPPRKYTSGRLRDCHELRSCLCLHAQAEIQVHASIHCHLHVHCISRALPRAATRSLLDHFHQRETFIRTLSNPQPQHHSTTSIHFNLHQSQPPWLGLYALQQLGRKPRHTTTQTLPPRRAQVFHRDQSWPIPKRPG